MTTILVTGANGQLGNEMRNMARVDQTRRYIFTDVQELDITDLAQVQKFLAENPVDFVVNCAAYTAVDKAESEIELCRKINACAVYPGQFYLPPVSCEAMYDRSIRATTEGRRVEVE